MTIRTPIIGRLRFAASGLLLSVLGLPVAGSFGSFNATMFPQRAPPQLTIVTLALLFSVSQFPRGSPADAGVAMAGLHMVNAPRSIPLWLAAQPSRRDGESAGAVASSA